MNVKYFVLIVIITFNSNAMAGDYVAVQSFNCTYVSRAFHDEDAFRKTIKPPPCTRGIFYRSDARNSKLYCWVPYRLECISFA